MASLQARHGKHCTLWPWSTFKAAASGKGCTCVPLYHVVHRDDGKLIRDPVGHNRKEAERALDARRGDIARNDYKGLTNVRFEQWADSWIADVEATGGKTSTINAYRVTLEYAKRAIGKRIVRDLDSGDISAVLRYIKEHPTGRKVSDTTLAKHMRQLSSCLGAAVPKYATSNPVAAMSASVRPRVTKRRPSYFTNAELQRLWPEIADRPVYLALFKTAVATGMRRGELAALRWDDIKLLDREIHVSRTYHGGTGETSTKSGENRVLDLTPQAAEVLQAWYAETGGDGLVFAAETGGYLDNNYPARRVLYPAMERAGIPREGEHGRKRTLHSFRHTFARIALEQGTPIVWVKEQLGHSSIDLTVDTYGTWERAAQKKQAESLAGVFPI